MNRTISLPALIHILWQKKYLIILSMFVCASLGFFIGTSTYKPYYTAEAQLEFPHQKVKHKRDQSFSDATAIGVYRIQAMDRQVLQVVQRHLKKDFQLSISMAQLKEQINTIPPSDNSMILRIQAQANTPRQAMLVANTHLIIFTTKVEQFNHLKNVKIHRFASMSTHPVNQSNAKKYAVYGGIVGFILAILFTLWRILFI